MPEKIVLIDGHSILNRAFYGLPMLTNSEGKHTNAVYGFLNIMFKVLEEEQADYVAVAFDLHAPTFRHKMYEAYKGTRKPMPEELREQVPLMKEMLGAMHIPVMSLEGYEADDILGTVSRQMERAGLSVSIVSGDRDLLQLDSEDKGNRDRNRGLLCRPGKGKISGDTDPVHRSEGINGRYKRQHPGCAGHRREDGDKDHRAVWFNRGGLCSCRCDHASPCAGVSAESL